MNPVDDTVPRCRVCGGGEARPRRSFARTRVYQCPACTFVFCHPIPRPTTSSAGPVSIQTEESYTERLLNPRPSELSRCARMAKNRHREYSRRLGRSSFRLLEVGCGTGCMSTTFVDLGVDYLGIDIDERVVAAALSLGSVNVHHADLMSLQESETYDVICLSQVLEHIAEPTDFVEKLLALLSPDGLLHCDVPNHFAAAGLPSRVVRLRRERYGGIDFPHHSFSYTAPALHQLLSKELELEMFTVNPDHEVWGKANDLSPSQRAFFLAADWIGKRSILVALGRRRPREQTGGNN